MIVLDYKAIGRRIKAYRKRSHLTQEALAEIVDISPPHMSNIETGNSKLSLNALVNLANALGVGTDALLADNLKANKVVLHKEVAKIFEACEGEELAMMVDLVKDFHINYHKHKK